MWFDRWVSQSVNVDMYYCCYRFPFGELIKARESLYILLDFHSLNIIITKSLSYSLVQAKSKLILLETSDGYEAFEYK